MIGSDQKVDASNKVLIHSRSSFNVQCDPIDQFYHQNSRPPTLVQQGAKRRTGDDTPPTSASRPYPNACQGSERFIGRGGGGGASIGNIGIPRAAQRFRGSASFEEEARERPISSPAFQQCGFICVTISREGKGGSDWPSKEYTGWPCIT